MTRHQTRYEDMSPKGKLTVMVQSDGDVILHILQDDGQSADIEFCAPGAGGGGSSRTWRALQAVHEAMREDNEDPRQSHRSPHSAGPKP